MFLQQQQQNRWNGVKETEKVCSLLSLYSLCKLLTEHEMKDKNK